jgi:hypothetical protein
MTKTWQIPVMKEGRYLFPSYSSLDLFYFFTFIILIINIVFTLDILFFMVPKFLYWKLGGMYENFQSTTPRDPHSNNLLHQTKTFVIQKHVIANKLKLSRDMLCAGAPPIKKKIIVKYDDFQISNVT